ncbi:DUF1697 domain-containing protein [Fusibacter ferrireducens]|uniref:DUF1697 domain-containing protein n=1 Tax=Fusibacter ferrireducens TaxID=2785058 RepID=A0ABR9ZN86_9FIRM|nr:DUF1697 domain-containing protein [Fusibacter ferrireducens]
MRLNHIFSSYPRLFPYDQDVFINVRTYLNSGNIILSTHLGKSDAKSRIQRIIAELFKINPSILVF